MIKNKSTYIKFFCTLFILLFSLYSLTGCNPSNSPITREATINDISIDVKQEISLNMTYTMIPQLDIDDLQITFKFYNKDKKVLSTKIKDIGNVKKGIQYQINISLTEFSFWDLFKITSTSARVTNGKVSII